MWGETTRVENRGETTRGEMTRGKIFGGETSCYHPDKLQKELEKVQNRAASL